MLLRWRRNSLPRRVLFYYFYLFASAIEFRARNLLLSDVEMTRDIKFSSLAIYVLENKINSFAFTFKFIYLPITLKTQVKFLDSK